MMSMIDYIGSIIIPTQITIAALCVFYGAYVVLFGISVNILVRRKKGQYRYYLLVATVVLFVLASANVALWIISDIASICYLYPLVEPESRSNCWEPPKRLNDAVFETALASSAIADAILLWRCYTVWGRQLKIMILPALVYLVTHVSGLVLSSSDVFGGYIMVNAVAAGIVALNNLLLSSLIAYRIFRISREVAVHLGSRARNMYRTVISATLESGLLYFTFLIVYVMVSVTGGDASDARTQMIAICVHIWGPIAGIVPTIVIVRVTLGISFDNVESVIVSIRAATTRDEDVPPVIDISRPAISTTTE